MRGDYRKVAILLLDLAEEELEAEAEVRTLRKPERKSLSDLLGEGEELHFLADLAVVTLLGLLEEYEILVEHSLLREGNTVDTGEHMTVLVASPICACDSEELHGLDHGSVLEVRSAAEVGEVAVLVEGDGAVLEVADEFALVLVALLGEVLESLGLADLGAYELLLLAGELDHLVLDGLEFGLNELMAAEIDVIVESVLDCRSDTELDARIESLESFCHKM